MIPATAGTELNCATKLNEPDHENGRKIYIHFRLFQLAQDRSDPKRRMRFRSSFDDMHKYWHHPVQIMPLPAVMRGASRCTPLDSPQLALGLRLSFNAVFYMMTNGGLGNATEISAFRHESADLSLKVSAPVFFSSTAH